MLRPPKGHVLGASPVRAGPPPQWCEDVPLLWHHLADTAWDDGSPRQTSTITVFVEDARVKVCLTDREGGAVLFRSGASLVDALVGLEEALRDGGADWRASKRDRAR